MGSLTWVYTTGGVNLSRAIFKKLVSCPAGGQNEVRDWSLIMGRGEGGYKTGGGQVKFYPYEKWGGGEFKQC